MRARSARKSAVLRENTVAREGFPDHGQRTTEFFSDAPGLLYRIFRFCYGYRYVRRGPVGAGFSLPVFVLAGAKPRRLKPALLV
jgi:hypothetical protein